MVMDDLKVRRAPSGKFYTVWNGHPICDAHGSLRYFGSEEEARKAPECWDLIWRSERRRRSDQPKRATSTWPNHFPASAERVRNAVPQDDLTDIDRELLVLAATSTRL
jgi:hypothetical protein